MAIAPALALAPEVVFVAIGGLLFAWAGLVLLAPMLVRLAALLPVFGQSLSTWAGNLVAQAQADAAAWTEQAVEPAAALIAAPAIKLDHVLTQIEAVFAAVADAIANTAGGVWGVIERKVEQIADAAAARVQAWAAAGIASVVGLTQWVHKAVDADIHNWLGIQRGELQRKIDQAQAGAETYTDTQVAGATAAAGRAQTAADQAAQAAAGAQGLADATAAQVGDLSPAAVDGGLAQTLADAQGYTDAAAGALSRTIAGAAGVAAGAAAAAAAVATDLSTYRQQCGDPLCEGVLPQLRALQDLQSVLGAGELLDLIVALLRDPQGAAAELEGLLGGTVQTFAGLFAGLAGVKL